MRKEEVAVPRNIFFRLKSLAYLTIFGLILSPISMYAEATLNADFERSSLAPQQSVSGTVTDANGTPLPGANVIVKGTTNGTQTDFDGNFIIEAATDAVLTVSYIGYITKEVPVNGQSTITIQLAENTNALDEVVVIGYGTSSRASVSSAVSSVSSADLVETPAIGVQQALQGRASGVNVISAGLPGNNPLVTIRGLGTFGNNQPLYIVDGVQTGSLNDIPAESIESVDILKDAASAAIYGSRGSNGVVIITTKGGKKGKTTFSVNTYTGFSNVIKTLDVLNTQQYIEYAREFDFDPNTDGNQLPPAFNDPGFDPSINTNWQDEVFRTALIQNVDVEARGGSDIGTYSVRTGYFNQEGTFLNSNYRRYNVGINTNFNLGKKIKVGQTLNFTLSRTERGGGNVLLEASRMAPYLPVFDDETGFFSTTSTNFDGQDAVNPVQRLSINENLNDRTVVVGSIFGSYEILDGLVYNITVGLDHSYSNDTNFGGFIPTGQRARDFATFRRANNRFLRTIVTNTLNYKTTLEEKHNLDVLAGYERIKSDNEFFSSNSQNSLTDQLRQLNQAEFPIIFSSSAQGALQSVFGRISYDYDKTFLLSATLRTDGSSRFGSDNRWGTFPSVSGGVNLYNLFLEDVDSPVSNLKLRASWGLTGNNNIGDFLFSSGLQTDFNFIVDGNLIAGTRPARLSNPSLQWEELESLNIGFDLGLFNNNLTLSAEYFNNASDGLLVAVPTPTSSGDTAGSLTQNVGGIETKGFEVNLGYNDYSGDFKWGVNINATTLSSEVTSLGTAETIFGPTTSAGQFINRLFVGEPVYHFFGYEMDGIFQNQAEVDAANQTIGGGVGDVRFRDLNGDGEVNADDRTVIGDPTPDLTLGADFSFQYKNFDAAVFITGTYGNDVYNTRQVSLIQQDRLFNRGVEVLNRWTGPGTSNTIPQAGGSTNNISVSDRFVEDGSFTRFRNISLGYSLGDSALSKVLNGSINKLRLYVSGQNVFTITDYKGYDPEIGGTVDNNGNVNAFGVDTVIYPQPRTFLMGLQIEF